MCRQKCLLHTNQVSILPIFCEQLLCQYFFDKKLQSQTVIEDMLLRKALFTRDIFAHNIAILRQKYIAIIGVTDFYANQGKLLTKICTRYITSFRRLPWFLKSLPWPLDIYGSKIYFYRNIFLSQYCASKCLVWMRPKTLI